MNISLEIRNPFLNLEQTWNDCAWPQEEFFQEEEFFPLLNATSNPLSRVCWVISRFGIEMPDTCGYVTGRFNILE